MAKLPPFPIAADGTYEHEKCIAHIKEHNPTMEYLPNEKDIALVNYLLGFISQKFGMKVLHIIARDRSDSAMQCKTMFLYFCAESSKMNQKCIGAFVGLDHTVVVHSRRRHESYLATPNSKYDAYREITTAIGDDKTYITGSKMQQQLKKQTREAAKVLCTKFAQFLGHKCIDHKIEAFLAKEFPEEENTTS